MCCKAPDFRHGNIRHVHYSCKGEYKMKNSHILKILACAMVLSAAITAGAFSNFGTTSFDTNISAAQSAEINSISVEQAKEIALSHAGKTADQVQFVKIKQDWEHGRTVYEIEFIANDNEYEYEIDANTGAIVKWEVESIYS